MLQQRSAGRSGYSGRMQGFGILKGHAQGRIQDFPKGGGGGGGGLDPRYEKQGGGGRLAEEGRNLI